MLYTLCWEQEIAFTVTPYTSFMEQCQTKIKDKILQVDSKYKGQGPKEITLTDQWWNYNA